MRKTIYLFNRAKRFLPLQFARVVHRVEMNKDRITKFWNNDIIINFRKLRPEYLWYKLTAQWRILQCNNRVVCLTSNKWPCTCKTYTQYDIKEIRFPWYFKRNKHLRFFQICGGSVQDFGNSNIHTKSKSFYIFGRMLLSLKYKTTLRFYSHE